MAKRRHHTAFATAHSIYQHGRNAKYIYNRLRSKRRSTRTRTLTIDPSVQSTSMEVARNFQVTDAKKFSKAKPQKKDFFQLYNLQTAIMQNTLTTSTSQGRQQIEQMNHFLQFNHIRDLTDAFNGTNDHGRIYIHTASFEMLCTNMSNWQVIVDLYDVIATNDCRQDVTSAFATAAQVSAGGIGIGEVALTHAIMGVNPSDLKGFTNQWRPFKHNRVYLNPGEVWIHKGFRFLNRKIPIQELMQSYSDSTPGNYIPGITAACLALVKGVPVHGTTHNVTTSGAQELAIATSYRLRYSVLPESVSGDILNSSTLFATGVASTSKMETETDQAATLENA